MVDVAINRRAAPYRFVSEGVSVGSEQGGLRPQEGPGHTASRGRRLLLELAFQGGHLVGWGRGARKGEREKKTSREGQEKAKGMGGGVLGRREGGWRGKKLNYHL